MLHLLPDEVIRALVDVGSQSAEFFRLMCLTEIRDGNAEAAAHWARKCCRQRRQTVRLVRLFNDAVLEAAIWGAEATR